MRIAVVKFPGTNSERDVLHALEVIPGAKPYFVLSRDGSGELAGADGIIIPSGASFKEYERTGMTKPVEEMMSAIKERADSGVPVIGIGNGFQFLTEADLLPGKLLPNESGRFVCKWVYLRVCNEPSQFTQGLEGAVIRVPVAHSEGRFFSEGKELRDLMKTGRVVFRYCNEDGEIDPLANPNGSVKNIAGLVNKQGNVLGMVPHPERASRTVLSSTDGLMILENFVRAMSML
ncbi:MAG: phosphoribosylformylglycinamidine synthase I [Candidatus Hodarchaeota archaeon]